MRLPACGDSFVAPITKTKYVARFTSFLDAQRIAAMHQDGDRLDFVVARYSASHDTRPGPWKKPYLVLGRNGATFPESSATHLIITYLQCPEEREHVARPSTVVILLEGVRCLADALRAYPVLERPFEFCQSSKFRSFQNAISTLTVNCEQRVGTGLRAAKH